MDFRTIVLAVALACVLAGCNKPVEQTEPSPLAETAQLDVQALHKTATALFATLPERMDPPDAEVALAQVELGRTLFYETRLSEGGEISCNSCHDLTRYGVDGMPTSVGHQGQRGDRNAPTVYNAALHVAQFWDGRSPDVEDQAKGPVMNPVEMAMGSEAEVAARLSALPEYQELFAKAFPGEPISLDTAARAIGAFERGLVTPSPFDRFLDGELEALSAEQQRGLKTFVDVGCASCHMGPAVGGSMFQKLGLKKPYQTEDVGRAKVTGQETDRYRFKVPSMRNVAETGPYFHDGSVPTLEDAVRLMAVHQLGTELTQQQMADIIAFLKSLTGELPADYIPPPSRP